MEKKETLKDSLDVTIFDDIIVNPPTASTQTQTQFHIPNKLSVVDMCSWSTPPPLPTPPPPTSTHIPTPTATPPPTSPPPTRRSSPPPPKQKPDGPPSRRDRRENWR